MFSLNHRVLQLNSLIDTGIEVSKLGQGSSPEHLALERAASLTNASKGAVKITRHRDIKPSNILFDRKNNPYISDFGIAKLSQSQTGNVTGSAIIGTPAYMAPEQAQGDETDGRADIYSLGIILFEMRTGRQPYEADTPMGVAIKHITEPVPYILAANPSLPAGMEAIIQKAMAKNKIDRYPTAVEMMNALRDVVRTTTTQMQTRVAAPPVPKTMVSKKAAAPSAKIPAKKVFNPILVVLPVLALALLGAGGFFVFNGLNGPQAANTPAAVDTSTSAPLPTSTSAATQSPTEKPTARLAAPTESLPTSTQPPAAPSVPVLGEVDKIALVANNEIWSMNVDGSEPRQLTTDGAPKSDLQWLDRNTLLFISGTIVKYYQLDTDSVETLASFPPSYSLDAYRVSHNGKQAMIAMNNEIFVVPFGLEAMKDVDSRSKLMNMNGACILPAPKTKDMAAALDRLVGQATALIVLAGPDEAVEKSVRNMPGAKTLRAAYLNIRDLLGYDRVLLPMGALEALGTALAA